MKYQNETGKDFLSTISGCDRIGSDLILHAFLEKTSERKRHGEPLYTIDICDYRRAFARCGAWFGITAGYFCKRR
jgi:hypothetical protein